MFIENPVDNYFTNPLFIAEVKDNKDPDYNCRVKVKIEGLHDKISDGDLPWAARLDSTFLGIKDETAIRHCIPEVKSKVLVLCVGNDPNSLVYLGVLHKKIDNVSPKEEDPYLKTWGIYGKEKQFIGLDKVLKAFELLLNGDIDLVVDKAKKLIIHVKESVNIECKTAEIKVTESAKITTGKVAEDRIYEETTKDPKDHKDDSKDNTSVEITKEKAIVKCGDKSTITLEKQKATVDTKDTIITGDLKVEGEVKCEKDVKVEGKVDVNKDIKAKGSVESKKEVKVNSTTLTKHKHHYSWTKGAGNSDTQTGQG